MIQSPATPRPNDVPDADNLAESAAGEEDPGASLDVGASSTGIAGELPQAQADAMARQRAEQAREEASQRSAEKVAQERRHPSAPDDRAAG